MKNTFLNVLLFSLFAVGAGLLFSWMSSEKTPPATDLPWQIEATADGSIRVFQTQLGRTTLGEFTRRYHEAPEVTLFEHRDGRKVVEAYFNAVTIAGLKAKVVLSFQMEQAKLNAMYDRGVRISTLGSGTRKISLASVDMEIMPHAIISGVTFIPSINLDAALVQKRFGEPAEKIKDSRSAAVHWLYPEKGLDLVLSETEKDVLQYVQPKNFDQVVLPLKHATPAK